VNFSSFISTTPELLGGERVELHELRPGFARWRQFYQIARWLRGLTGSEAQPDTVTVTPKLRATILDFYG
jgi:hypothetical protein